MTQQETAAYAVTITNRLYAYGETVDAAWADFRAQISGGSPRTQARLLERADISPLNVDQASEVAECIAAPVIAWDIER